MAKRRKTSSRSIHNRPDGLYNRGYLDLVLKRMTGPEGENKNPFALVMIDINNFKSICQEYGGAVGARIFIELTSLLKRSIRHFDICFRYARDKIVIILPYADRGTAQDVITRLKTRIEIHKFPVDERKERFIDLATAIAIFPDDGMKPGQLLKRANSLLPGMKDREQTPTTSFLLKTKLLPPHLKGAVIPRRRLLDLLKEGLKRKLICVVADAGYGKTTLLTQLIEEQRLPCVYYELTSEDSDLMVFLAYLTRGLDQIQAGLTERARRVLDQGTAMIKNHKLVVGILINEIFEKRKEPFIIVLDDYHTLNDDSHVHEALNYLLENLPEVIRVVISSRADPRLPSLVKLRAKQDLYELSREDLRFTEGEIKILLSDRYGVTLTDEDLRHVAKHTEGWITGIQLILQSADKDRKSVKEKLNGYLEADQPLFEYFSSEILRYEDPESQEFLKINSILEVMTPGICNKISGISDSDHRLRELERRNLFLYRIGGDEYKYHSLFRNYLIQQLNKNRFKMLNRTAARYYQATGNLEAAIDHYFASGSFSRAGRLIQRIMFEMVNQARLGKIFQWINQLPDDTIKKYPLILNPLAIIYGLQGDLRMADRVCQRTEDLLRSPRCRTELAGTYVIHGNVLINMCAYEGALKLLKKALRICPASAAKNKARIFNMLGILYQQMDNFNKAHYYLARGYTLAKELKEMRMMIVLEYDLALFLTRKGEMRRALELLQGLLDRIQNKYTIQIGVVYTGAARIALNLGLTDQAQHILEQGWRICQPHQDLFSEAALCVGFGLLYTHKMNWQRAEYYLKRGYQGFRRLNLKHLEFPPLLYLTQLYRFQRNFPKNEKYLALLRQSLNNLEDSRAALFFVESSLTKIASRQHREARKLLAVNHRLAKKFDLDVDRFSYFLIRASVYLEEGNETVARRALSTAVKIARKNGYDGLLTRELRSMPHLVKFAISNKIEREYLLSLDILETGPRMRFKIQFLGSLGIFDGNGNALPVDWSTEKARSLFAFMIVNRGTPMHREIVIEGLWPGQPKNLASINFRTTATRMRKSLTEAFAGQTAQHNILIEQHRRYQLLPGVQLTVDIEEFNSLLNEAERTESVEEKARLGNQAIRLYKGDLLPDIYDAWTDDLRRVYRTRFLNTVDWLAHFKADRQDQLGAAQLCEIYLATDPLDEEIAKLHMRCLAGLGRIKDVEQCYRILEEALKKELNITPSEATREIFLACAGRRQR